MSDEIYENMEKMPNVISEKSYDHKFQSMIYQHQHSWKK